MKKNIKLLSAVIIGLLKPFAVLAVNYPNPATGFLVDLTKFGKANTFGDLLLYLVEIALGIVGILSIGFIIFGGFQYITSRGDEEQAATGKRTLTNAIIGLTIIVLSYVMVSIVLNTFMPPPVAP